MVTETEIEIALIAILESHQLEDSLPDQTPRMLRAQVAERLGVESIDDFKEFVKSCISNFLNKPKIQPKENKPIRNKKKPIKSRKTKRDASSESSDEFSSESSSEDDEGTPNSPSALRSIAKAVGVPPSFWSDLDKSSASQISERLAAFCDSKSVKRKGPVPTMKEAKKYKAQREAAAELEGIAASNIVSGKRKRSQDFIPLFL